MKKEVGSIDVLINNTDSIKNTFNCDFEFDNFTLRVHEKRGKESQNILRDKKKFLIKTSHLGVWLYQEKL